MNPNEALQWIDYLSEVVEKIILNMCVTVKQNVKASAGDSDTVKPQLVTFTLLLRTDYTKQIEYHMQASTL